MWQWIFVCLIGASCIITQGERFFPAERIAINLNLPVFAENSLRNHVLDAFPKGAICRWLLAKINYYKQDFSDMEHQIQLACVDPQFAYLNALLHWHQQQRVLLTPLLLDRQEGILGQCLSTFNFILHEPLGSPHWAQFWSQPYYQSYPEHEMLTALMSTMVFSIQRNHFNPNSHILDWHSVSSSLWAQKRYEELADFLAQVASKLTSNRDRAYCFLGLLRVKTLLNQDSTKDVMTYLSFSKEPISQLNSILPEWMNTVSNLQQRLKGLRQFRKIYKREKLNINGQYIQLLEIHCLVLDNQLERAQKSLTKLLPHLNEDLYTSAYELLAKIEFLRQPPNYSAAANALEEAKKYTKQKHKILIYSKIQNECYCLLKDYHRAYCVLQESLFKGQYTPLASDLAYEWCLCGILCKSTPEDLEQQFQYCREKHLLTQYKEQQIRLYFIQYQFKHDNFQLALHYLNQHVFLNVFNPEISLMRAKCEYRLGNIREALKIMNQINNVPADILPEWKLWQAYIYNDLEQLMDAEQCLETLFKFPIVTSEIQTYGKLLQAEIFSKQHDLNQAKQVLLDLESKTNQEWWPVVLFQAGCYAEQNGLTGQKEAISIFQKIYDRYPHHPLSQDARLKQGVLLMNLNQMDLAQAIFETLLPSLKHIQALWCQYLIQKCNLMLNKCSLLVSRNQLELLLQEEMPLSLRLEIVLQLAFIYHDEGNLKALQKLLWDECYPIFDIKNKQDFSASEIYWFSRCLMTLVQYTKDKTTIRQIYSLMVEAELPNTSLVKQYLNE